MASSYSHTCIPQENTVVQDLFWREYNRKQIPDDALEGADGKYIGQVNFHQKLLPACIDPDQNHVIIVTGRKQIVTENVKILCTNFPKKFYWEDIDFNCKYDCECSFLNNIVKGGFENKKYNLYIGKAYHLCEWKIGKVVPREKKLTKGLNLWKDNGTIDRIQTFSVLKYDPSR